MRHCQFILRAFAALAIGGCTSTTTITVSPSPQTPVCEASRPALVYWQTQWRDDQKDVLERDTAAAAGIGQFFVCSGCFKSALLERLPHLSEDQARISAAKAVSRNNNVVLLSVRELGPTVKIGASPALLEGGTEVVLDISELTFKEATPRKFTVQWNSGGPGVLKGTASLPQDMQAALAAALQPASR